MAGEKEIRNKIRSVKNMQKITSAMEMVAASKIRKAQDQMEASRPYAERIRRVVGHLAHANPDYKHPFLVEREVKRVGYIIISTDRGLCGGLNVNMFKTVIGELSKWRQENVEVDLALVGAKAVQFFRRLGGNVVFSPGDVEALGSGLRIDNPTFTGTTEGGDRFRFTAELVEPDAAPPQRAPTRPDSHHDRRLLRFGVICSA